LETSTADGYDDESESEDVKDDLLRMEKDVGALLLIIVNFISFF